MADSNQTKKYELQGWEAPVALAAIFGGFWYKHGYQIEVWVHEHMVRIVLSAMLFLVALGYFVVWRFKRKNAEEIKRMRKLAEARPKSPTQYYQRRLKKDFDHE